MIYFYQYEILLACFIYLFSAIITGFIVLVQCFLGGVKFAAYTFFIILLSHLYVIVFLTLSLSYNV